MLNEEDCLRIAGAAVGSGSGVTLEQELLHFKVTPKSTSGFLGETFHLEITTRLKPTGETINLEFFVKQIPKSNRAQEKLVRDSGVFPKEIGIYREVLERFEEHIEGRVYPKYMYSKGDELLVMENLVGYVNESVYAYFSVYKCEATLAALAKFHAASIIYEVKHSVRLNQLVPQHLYETLFADNVNNQLYENLEVSFVAVDAILNSYYSHLSEETLAKVRAFVRTIRVRLRKPERDDRCNVLTHGDLWTNNVMFKYDQKHHNRIREVRIVDFQLARYMPPAFDVLMLLHLTLPREERRQEWNHLTAFYYDHLTKALVKSGGVDIERVLGWQEFQKSLEEELPTVLSLAILYLHYIKIPKKSIAKVMADPQLYDQIVSVNRDQLILESMKTDNHYNKAVKDALEDIMQYVQNQGT